MYGLLTTDYRIITSEGRENLRNFYNFWSQDIDDIGEQLITQTWNDATSAAGEAFPDSEEDQQLFTVAYFGMKALIMAASGAGVGGLVLLEVGGVAHLQELHNQHSKLLMMLDQSL